MTARDAAKVSAVTSMNWASIDGTLCGRRRR